MKVGPVLCRTKIVQFVQFVTYKLFLKWPYVKQDNATEGGLNF